MKQQGTYGWKPTKLGRYFRIKHGWAFKGEFFADAGPYVLLTPGNFKEDGGLQGRGEREKYYTGDFPDEFLLKRGDFLVVMTDLTQNAPILGSPAIVPEDDRFLHNQRLGKIFELNEAELNKDFLYYLFNSAGVRAQIKASATGATVKHTAPERIYSVNVEVPPLSVQRRIAAILSAYDDLIDNNQRRIKILEEMARSLYREWFVNFRYPGHDKVPLVDSPLGKIPKGWEVKLVKNILSRRTAGTVYREADVKPEGSIQVLDQSTNDLLGFHDNEPDHFASPAMPIAIFGDHTCKMQIVIEPFSVGPNVVPFVAAQELPTAYVFHAVNSLVQTQEYKRHWIPLNAKEIVVADHVAAQRFAFLIQPMLVAQATWRKAIRNLRRTRDLLLPRLLSGAIPLDDISTAAATDSTASQSVARVTARA